MQERRESQVGEIDTGGFRERFPALAAALPGREADDVVGACDVVHADAGEALTEEGADSDALLLVWDGELDVAIATGDGAKTVATLGAGDELGEVSLLDPGPATATVTASRPSVVLRLDHVALEHLLEESPRAAADLLAALTHTLAERVEASMDRLDAVLDAGGDRAEELVEVEHLLYEGKGA